MHQTFRTCQTRKGTLRMEFIVHFLHRRGISFERMMVVFPRKRDIVACDNGYTILKQ